MMVPVARRAWGENHGQWWFMVPAPPLVSVSFWSSYASPLGGSCE